MIKISTEDFAETDDGLTTDLVFTFTTKYPDVGPKVEIENENVSEPEISQRFCFNSIRFQFQDSVLNQKLMDMFNSMIEENLGSEMIFSLVIKVEFLCCERI